MGCGEFVETNEVAGRQGQCADGLGLRGPSDIMMKIRANRTYEAEVLDVCADAVI